MFSFLIISALFSSMSFLFADITIFIIVSLMFIFKLFLFLIFLFVYLKIKFIEVSSSLSCVLSWTKYWSKFSSINFESPAYSLKVTILFISLKNLSLV